MDMWSGHSCPLPLLSTPQQIFVIPILRRSRRVRNLLLDGGHSCPERDRVLVRVRWVPHFSRVLCARSGVVCINHFASGVIPNARAFTSGRRDLPRTCSIPRLELAATNPKLARPKLSVKVG